MAQISLHDYLQQIDTLLEENRLSEAIAHCRHILQKFPRHVETYRYYGKALLEQQKYDDAVDIFKRVLSADPEDFISHVGLAITHKEKGEVPQAIWHFERAFEMDPYNATIQEELRALYAIRDGQRPERITLTRGALARLYFRGNLYRQAADELRHLLAKNGDSQEGERLDLQTLLAETLWRDDQRVDVVDVCLRILEKTPDSIKANAILAEVWLMSGRSDEAYEYLQRLRTLTRPEKAYLDPDSVIGRAFSTNGVIDLPEKVLIDELDYIPVAQELSGEADWVSELTIEPEEVDEEASWLDEIEKVDAEVFAEAAASDDDDMLDWLRDVATTDEEEGGGTIVLEDFEDEQPEEALEGTSSESPLDWFTDGLEASQQSASDVPDWLSEVTASAEADMWNSAIEANESQAEVEEESEAEGPEVEKAETPDWIRDAAQDIEPTAGWIEEDEEELWAPQVDASDTFDADSDWLSQDDADDDFAEWLEEAGVAGPSSEEMLPDWLTESGAESGQDFPDFTVEDAVFSKTGEKIPTWLLGKEEESETEVDSAESDMETETAAGARKEADDPFISAAFEARADELPEWLQEAQAEAESDPLSKADELPEWLRADTGFLDKEQETETEAEIEAEPEPVEDSLDWLADFETAEEPEPGDGTLGIELEDELPDWLNEIGPVDEPGDEEQGEEGNIEDMPEWLDQIGSAELLDITSEAVDEDLSMDELPDWLSEFGETEQSESIEDQLFGQQAGADDTAEWPVDEYEPEEQTGEALPDWLEASPDLIAGETDINQESLPDWLSSGQEDLVREEMVMGNAEEQDNKDSDVPEDLDEAMKWLEELAAEQGANLDELPSLQKDVTAEQPSIVEDDDVPDWLKADLSDGDLSGEDDLPDWLKQEAELMGGDDWLNLAGEDELDLTSLEFEDTDAAEPAQAGEIPDWLKQQMPEDLQDQDDTAESGEDDYGWLDKMAAGEGAPLEELPTLSWDDDQDDIDLDFEDSDFSWMDDVPEVEVDSGELAIEEPATFDETGDEAMMAVPDDPDEAMAWLERLAAQQGANLDELPTVADTDFEMETTDVLDFDSEAPTVIDMPADEAYEEAGFEIPEDPDEAMAWLEQLAARQGANLDELPSVDVVPEQVTPFSEALAGLDELEMEPEVVSELDSDAELEMALAELSGIDMPEDDDEALAWLASLTGGTAEPEPQAAPEPEMVETAEASLEVVVDESEMEPEPGQTFEAENLFENLEPETDEESITALDEAPEEDSFFDLIEDESDQLIDLPDDLAEDIRGSFDTDELDSALPDWLKFEPMGETSREELDWLDSFGDSDVDSWLEAEELVSQFNMEAISDAPEPETGIVPEPEPEPLFDTGPLRQVETPVIEEFEVEPAPSGPVNEDQLESARSALEVGDVNTALEQYTVMLQSGQGVPMVIADLETAATKHTKVAPLQRLLGDAYMQNGQLQKAIDTYRQALDNL